jgi:hypothetical protein
MVPQIGIKATRLAHWRDQRLLLLKRVIRETTGQTGEAQ